MIIEMILELLYCLGGMLLSFIVFDILFYALNKSILKLFVPLQNYFSKVRKKEFFRMFIYTIFLGVSVVIKDILDLNYFMFGLTLGIFYSFTNMLFKNGIISE